MTTRSWYRLATPLSLIDLQVNSPDNTHVNVGLPPTPISNPSLAALRALCQRVSARLVTSSRLRQVRVDHGDKTALTQHAADGGTGRVFLSIFLSSGFSRFGGDSTLPPTAAKVNRYFFNNLVAFATKESVLNLWRSIFIRVLQIPQISSFRLNMTNVIQIHDENHFRTLLGSF